MTYSYYLEGTRRQALDKALRQDMIQYIISAGLFAIVYNVCMYCTVQWTLETPI